MSNLLENLNWRYAVKKFDTTKKVSDEDLQKIKQAVRLSPSSFGLQPYKILIIEDQDLKLKLKAESFNQNQIDTCSHLLVFVANTNLQKRIGEYCDLATFKDKKGLFDRLKFEAGARAFFGMASIDENRKFRIVTNQTYIALSFAMTACAELKIDSCPMEGFSSEGYSKILNLSSDEKACVLLPIGYRTEECAFEKTRFSEEVLFEKK